MMGSKGNFDWKQTGSDVSQVKWFRIKSNTKDEWLNCLPQIGTWEMWLLFLKYYIFYRYKDVATKMLLLVDVIVLSTGLTDD